MTNKNWLRIIRPTNNPALSDAISILNDSDILTR